MTDTKPTGLEGVVAADTALGFIDGKKGILMYCGYPIQQLGQYSMYEEVVYLLLHGELPTKAQLGEFIALLNAERDLGPSMAAQKAQYLDVHPMTNLRTMVSLLGAHDKEQEDDSPDAQMRKSIRLIAKIGTLVTAFERLQQGLEPVDPDPTLSYAANFLYMLHGTKPTDAQAKLFDRCLVLHAEHGFNASTFAARVTVATLADLYSGAVSAISTLKGPLHGGANERAMKMLESIGSPDNAEAFVMNALANKQKIMGIGHRVYKTEDPRAMFLCDLSAVIADADDVSKNIYEIGKVVRTVMKREKGLYANVDFCSGIVYRALGIPTRIFTPIFATARMAGWVAHMREQLANNRLIRPTENYIGPAERTYAPIESRK